MEIAVQFVKDFFIVIVTLLPIINPAGQVPVFISLTHDIPADDRREIARKISVYGFFLLIFSMAIGSYILKFFGISTSTVQVGGGFLVMVTGWNLLRADDSAKNDAVVGSTDSNIPKETAAASRAAWTKRAFYPLTFPNTVGPGSISVAVTLGATLRTARTIGQGEILLIIANVAALVVTALAIFVCYRYASRITAWLGEIGTIIFLRLSAFILLCLGVQIMWNGIAELIKSLQTVG